MSIKTLRPVAFGYAGLYVVPPHESPSGVGITLQVRSPALLYTSSFASCKVGRIRRFMGLYVCLTNACAVMYVYCIYCTCSVYIGCIVSLHNQTPRWTFFKASLGSTAALTASMFLHPWPLQACAEPQAGASPPRQILSAYILKVTTHGSRCTQVSVARSVFSTLNISFGPPVHFLTQGDL